jgi:hypothetical protein
MRWLKIFEEFTEFQLDEISKEEYYNEIDYKKRVGISEKKVLEFKKNLPIEYKVSYGRGNVPQTVDFLRAEYHIEIDHIMFCREFSIKKLNQYPDEDCFVMSYYYEEFVPMEAPKDIERQSFQRKTYYRFEESDFNQMVENPQILLDYLDKIQNESKP